MEENMEIELKNGEKLILEVSPLILEYVEDYKGGIEQLKKDAQGQKDVNGYSKTMYAISPIISSTVQKATGATTELLNSPDT